MKANLIAISCLLLTLSLHSNATVQSWCATSPNPDSCISTIQSNPRNDLKSSPQGAALILVGAAKASVGSTIAFINQSMKSETYEDVLAQLDDCLTGYQSIGADLDFDISSLYTTDTRLDVIDKLGEIEEEITYDCGWQMLTHRPQVVEQLADRVQSFSDALTAASGILYSIDE